MSDLGDIFNFQKFLGGDILKKWKDNPERLLLGINTPLETKLWGGITGKDYQPTVDMFGGNTEAQSRAAGAQGINTGPGEKMHDIARTITSLFAGGYGLNKLGLLGGFGSASGGGTATGASMPAAVPESPATLGKWGMVESSPGVWDRVAGSGSSGSDFYKYARLASIAQNMGEPPGPQGQAPQHQFVGPQVPTRPILMEKQPSPSMESADNPYLMMLRRRMYG